MFTIWLNYLAYQQVAVTIVKIWGRSREMLLMQSIFCFLNVTINVKLLKP